MERFKTYRKGTKGIPWTLRQITIVEGSPCERHENTWTTASGVITLSAGVVIPSIVQGFTQIYINIDKDKSNISLIDCSMLLLCWHLLTIYVVYLSILWMYLLSYVIIYQISNT